MNLNQDLNSSKKKNCSRIKTQQGRKKVYPFAGCHWPKNNSCISHVNKFSLFNGLIIKEVFKNIKLLSKLQMTKWVINLFLNLVFIKLNVLKCHSSSIKSTTCKTTILTNIIYFRILCVIIWEDVNYFHNCVKGLQIQGSVIATLELFFINKTNKEHYRSRVVESNTNGIHTSRKPVPQF